jgi:hypothetical protein
MKVRRHTNLRQQRFAQVKNSASNFREVAPHGSIEIQDPIIYFFPIAISGQHFERAIHDVLNAGSSHRPSKTKCFVTVVLGSAVNAIQSPIVTLSIQSNLFWPIFFASTGATSNTGGTNSQFSGIGICGK